MGSGAAVPHAASLGSRPRPMLACCGSRPGRHPPSPKTPAGGCALSGAAGCPTAAWVGVQSPRGWQGDFRSQKLLETTGAQKCRRPGAPGSASFRENVKRTKLSRARTLMSPVSVRPGQKQGGGSPSTHRRLSLQVAAQSGDTGSRVVTGHRTRCQALPGA